MQCYFNKFSEKPQCKNKARWSGTGTGNFTDEWVWCDDHKPREGFREMIKDATDTGKEE